MPVTETVEVLGGPHLDDVCKLFGIRNPGRYFGFVVLLLGGDHDGLEVNIKTDAPSQIEILNVLEAAATGLRD